VIHFATPDLEIEHKETSAPNPATSPSYGHGYTAHIEANIAELMHMAFQSDSNNGLSW
jgi:hypothetical protein